MRDFEIGTVHEKRSAKQWQGTLAAMVVPLLLLAVAAWTAGHVYSAPAPSPAAPAEAPQWDQVPPGVHLSENAINGADISALATSPDGSEALVLYGRLSGPNERDLYYTHDDGSGWSNPNPIVLTPGTDTGQPSLVYDDDGLAHAIWEEIDQALFYASFDGVNWNPTLIVTTTLPLFGTSLAVRGDGSIHAVWGNRPDIISSPNIYYAASTDDGATWTTPVPVADTEPTSLSPRLVVDAQDRLHVVWQEGTVTGGSEIAYSRFTGSGWTAPTTISPPWMTDAKVPAIAADGNDLHVSFTEARESPSDPNTVLQWAYYTGCSSNCTSSGNWSSAENASVQAVQVNETAPFDLVSDLIVDESCVYVFFHGYIESVSNNEVIWDVNSCDGWGNQGRDQVTGFNMRAIFPDVETRDGILHLIYQRVQGDERQVYYMSARLRSEPGPPGPVLLPAIFKRH